MTPTTTVAVPAAPAPALVAAPVLPLGPVAQLGCPPAPAPSPGPPAPEPWHPAVLVPDGQLPVASEPKPWASDPRAAFGKGMWVWMWKSTEGGDAAAVVERARRAGLHQLWVRVADSQSGFYAAAVLADLLPKAHAAHLSVIGWGFPYLYDPVGDAAWTGEAMDWRAPTGDRMDGFSADVERPSEGVMLTPRRVSVYFDAVRRRAGNRLVVATVYPPLDAYWQGKGYPFGAMAPYVDAFAPMIYWECTDPGEDARVAVERLTTLRPVHLIGQAYGMADIPGGRANAPSAAEILRFLDVGQRTGAIGASFWVWNTMDPPEWGALSSYPWRP
ncbi:MAG: hypothetical protein NVSMB12_07500 [Acidimicrobiales bacterium]